MRPEDLRVLSKPYPEGERSNSHGRLARSLGIDVPKARTLADEILADLDTERYGVGWWHPHPGTSRRILISDYLWSSVASIETNLVEATIHFLEAQDAWGQEGVRVAGASPIKPGRRALKLPPFESAHAEVVAQSAQLHMAGFLRAVGSAFDCLGGALIGVAGLRLPILTSSFQSTRRVLAEIKGENPAPRAQRELGQQLELLIDRAGPAGWLAWALDYRHMVVHRGRRLTTYRIGITRPVVLGPGGQPISRLRAKPSLALAPGRSEVEAFLHHDGQLILNEGADTTLAGVLGSTRDVVEGACALLLDLWRRRRTDPGLIEQPRAQWPRINPPGADFNGYQPSSSSNDFGSATTNPVVHRRMRAAAVSDDRRSQWAAFD